MINMMKKIGITPQHLKYLLFSVVAIALCVTAVYFFKNFPRDKDIKEYHLAIAGPMNSENEAGTTFQRASQLYIDQYNETNREKGFKIVLDTYNDENDAELAKIKATEISQNKNVIGVIGHNYSSVSAIGGEIYKKAGIPAISPTGTNINLTKGNDWFFRTIFNDKDQGHFLGYYAKTILGKSHVIIIGEDLAYGSYLAQIFEKSADQFGLQVRAKYSYRTKKENLDNDIKKVVDQLNPKNKNDLIFIAGHYQEGIKIIKMLRDRKIENVILTPDSFAHSGFTEGFSEYPKEIEKPGYYSNDVRVAVPILYDSANASAQDFFLKYLDKYKVEPDWRAGFAFDAALLFVNAIEKTGIHKKNLSLEDARTAIKEYLKSMNSSSNSIEGVTGLNFFDKDGNSPKPITIGQYKNKHLIPAMIQLKPVADVKDIPNIKEALKDDLVVKYGDRYMYKTNVIYTGTKINSIKEIDMENLSYTMDLDIWFRYSGSVDVRNIEFLNSVKPLQLRMPIEEVQLNNQLYRRYKLTGRFNADFLRPAGPHQHIFGMTFAHKSIPRDNIIFVADKVGGITMKNGATREDKKMLPPSSNWIIQKIWSFQALFQREILGNTKYINRISKHITYSQFTTIIEVTQNKFNVKDLFLSNTLLYFLLGLSTFMGLLFHPKIQFINYIYKIRLLFRKNRPRQGSYPERRKPGFSYMDVADETYEKREIKSYKRRQNDPILSLHHCWWLTSIALLSAFYSIENIWVDSVFGRVENSTLTTFILVFKILWWIVPAHIISSAVKTFVWEYFEKKSRRKIPKFLKGFTTFLIYVLAVFGITAFVYGQKLTSILGTSGIFVMIIGLALQMNISNMFAGMVLSVEKSINVNDWIKVGGLAAGKVLEVNWRATVIQTHTNVVLHIPNNNISESDFQNFTTPNNVIDQWLFVDIDPSVPFEKIRSCLLQALNRVEGIVKGSPVVKFNQYTHWSARYIMLYNIDDYGKKNAVKGPIWVEVLKMMQVKNIKVASMKVDPDMMMDERN